MTFTGRRLLAVASGLLATAALLLLAVTAFARAESGDDTPGKGSADVGFAQDMAVHHQQAVEMSFIVRDRTDDEAVRLLAYDIINTQANQRGMMLGWLRSWDAPVTPGGPPMTWMPGDHAHGTPDGALMPGMATDEQVAELGAASGRNAEILYLRLMTTHHRAGAEMADAGAELAATDEIRDLAAGMAEAQRAEIELMTDMLAERGAEPPPA
ncbi:DUF305 domain-containing protein [Streptomyces sp. RFCAC02]|uniref:DUF305 domain-containing protein n=1 Tax=Streptomyces sp. RFCAC02 TaxID=2499143 RepID=UPI001F0D8CC3|nr:DUF305 domain-containing protein [Streptomyces sp. RFCAC02]